MSAAAKLSAPREPAGSPEGSRFAPAKNMEPAARDGTAEQDDPRNQLLDALVRLIEAQVAADDLLGAALIARLQGLYPQKPKPQPAGPFDGLALAQILTALRVTASRRLTEADHLAVNAAKRIVLDAILLVAPDSRSGSRPGATEHCNQTRQGV